MKFKIAVGKNRFDKNCINTEFEWNEFLNRIARPIRTTETYEQYLAMPKEKQGILKDVGGFISGETKDGRRRATSIINRCMITLDADNIEPRTDVEDIEFGRWFMLYLRNIFNKKTF